MTDPNFSAIRARLRYETIEDFIKGYSRFISGGGMFIPMRPTNLKPIGTTIRFQFLLGDGATALLGEGVVLQVRQPDDANPRSPVGMLVKFTKLSQESKSLVDRILAEKNASLRGGVAEQPHQPKRPTKPFMDDDTANGDSADNTKESHRDIVAAAQVAASKASSNVTEHDATPFPGEAVPLDEPEPVEEPQAPIAARQVFETPVHPSDRNQHTRTDSDDTGVTANAVLDALLAEESEVEEPEAPTTDEPPTADVGDILAVDIEAEDAAANSPPATAPEPAAFELDFGFDSEAEEDAEPEFDLGMDSEPEAAEPAVADPEPAQFDVDPPTAEAPVLAPEPPTAEAPEPESVDVGSIEVPDEPGLAEESGYRSPQQIAETEGGLQILAFDELTEDAMRDLDDFSFAAEEADIDNMFDGLFGSSQAEDDFFGAFGGQSSVAETTGDSLSSVEFELPSEEELEDSEPLSPEPESVSFDSDDDDVFGAVAESEFSLDDAFSSPVLAEDDDNVFQPSPVDALDSDSVIDMDEASYITDAEPSVIVDEEPVQELGDESSPVLDLQDEADEDDILLDSVLSFHGVQEETSHSSEIDSLLGHLDDEDDGEKELTLRIGSEAEEEEPVEEEELEDNEYADEESLEFLLASARKEIEEKPAPEGDIIDQLFGGDEMPPPPSDAPVFELPTPTVKRKKGFMSKLFGKD